MIGNFSLDQLRVLVMIADTGSFSAAGRQLGRGRHSEFLRRRLNKKPVQARSNSVGPVRFGPSIATRRAADNAPERRVERVFPLIAEAIGNRSKSVAALCQPFFG